MSHTQDLQTFIIKDSDLKDIPDETFIVASKLHDVTDIQNDRMYVVCFTIPHTTYTIFKYRRVRKCLDKDLLFLNTDIPDKEGRILGFRVPVNDVVSVWEPKVIKMP